MTAPLTLEMLLDDAALFSLEYQLHLADLVGQDSWSVDLDAPSFHFSGPTPRTCHAVHLLGSAAPGLQSWLWAWANPVGFSPQVVAVTEQVRAFGEHYGIALLRAAEVPFSSLPPGRRDVIGAINVFIDVAKVVSGRWASYNGDVGGGTRAAFLLEHPDFVLGPLDPARFMRVLQQGLAELPINDYRRALHSYAGLRQVSLTWTPDGRSASITDPRVDVVVEFDELGRVSNLSGHLRGQPRRSAQ